jgi:hypothetical protein
MSLLIMAYQSFGVLGVSNQTTFQPRLREILHGNLRSSPGFKNGSKFKNIGLLYTHTRDVFKNLYE